MNKSTMKKIWIAALALMAFTAVHSTVSSAYGQVTTPVRPPGRR